MLFLLLIHSSHHIVRGDAQRMTARPILACFDFVAQLKLGIEMLAVHFPTHAVERRHLRRIVRDGDEPLLRYQLVKEVFFISRVRCENIADQILRRFVPNRNLV